MAEPKQNSPEVPNKKPVERITDGLKALKEMFKRGEKSESPGVRLKMKKLQEEVLAEPNVLAGSTKEQLLRLSSEIATLPKQTEAAGTLEDLKKQIELQLTLSTYTDDVRNEILDVLNGKKEYSGGEKEEKTLLDKYVVGPYKKVTKSAGGFFGVAGGAIGSTLYSGFTWLMDRWEGGRNYLAFKAGTALRDVRSIPYLGAFVDGVLAVIGVGKARMDLATSLKRQGFGLASFEKGERLAELFEMDPRFEQGKSKVASEAIAAKAREYYPEEEKTTLTLSELIKVVQRMHSGVAPKPKQKAGGDAKEGSEKGGGKSGEKPKDAQDKKSGEEDAKESEESKDAKEEEDAKEGETSQESENSGSSSDSSSDSDTELPADENASSNETPASDGDASPDVTPNIRYVVLADIPKAASFSKLKEGIPIGPHKIVKVLALPAGIQVGDRVWRLKGQTDKNKKMPYTITKAELGADGLKFAVNVFWGDTVKRESLPDFLNRLAKSSEKYPLIDKKGKNTNVAFELITP